MIPKSDLVPGCKYKGTCRNAEEAVWDGTRFIYIRHKFGDSYPQYIFHPDDDEVYDVFTPTEFINDFKVLSKLQMKEAQWYKGYGTVDEMMWVNGVFLYDWGTEEKETHHLDDGKLLPFLPVEEIKK
jgi:hypothetical protein